METQILLLISILTPIITGVVAAAKKGGLSVRYAPFAGIVAGLLLGLAYMPLDTQLSLAQALWGGGLAGLAAGGFYSAQNAVKKSV